MLTAVILMIGFVLVILENVTKIVHPQPVNEEGILWLGIIAVAINVLASLVVRKGKQRTSQFLACIFGRHSWLAGRHSNGDYSSIYGLVYPRSAFITSYFYLYSVESHSSLFGAH